MSDQEPPQENSIAQRIARELDLDRLLPGPPITRFTPMVEPPKTSAVILNWSRFSNVLIIVASLSRIEGIDEILIWNNNPQKLSREEGASPYPLKIVGVMLLVQDFKDTGCPLHKLTIHNSEENLYFQARYRACMMARSEYCLIQVFTNSTY